jgi:hypothetical protein
VSRSDELIADALRGIEEQAVVPRSMAAGAWRAGRRRHVVVRATSVAGAAVAVVAGAVLLPQAAASGPAQVPSAASTRVPIPPGQLRSPIQLRQVGKISGKPCPPGSHGLPGWPAPGAAANSSECFYLTPEGMTITSVHFITFGQPEPGQYAITVDLKAADRHRFGLLTAKLDGSRPPHDQLAIILRGHVLNAPMVGAEIIDGHVQIDGFASRALAEHIFRLLRTR